jgi:hypothetical protein
MRRDLYVGSSRIVTPADSAASRPPVRRGDGHLSGAVVASVNGNPLAGAIIMSMNGPQTRANERGEWTLSETPLGTRMVQVKAIGFYPDIRAMDIVDQAPPVRVALATMKSVLDTVRVVAQRATKYQAEFESRRRSGTGYYLDAAGIARTGAIFTSRLFNNLPGIRTVRTDTGNVIQMRGMFGSQGQVNGNPAENWCTPTIWVNGVRGIEYQDLDNFARIETIIGIETYSPVSAPMQYKETLSTWDSAGCGVILIWTK